jgi:hypothetical protein
MMAAMKARLLFTVIVLGVCSGRAHAQYAAVSGNCELPGQAAVISGISQSGTQPLAGTPLTTGSGVMASYPQCLVTVYPAGSSTPVATGSVYSNATGTALGNPFTANTDGSWTFYVVAGCYDVLISSGTPPGSKLPASKTLSGKCAGGGGSGGSVTGTANQIVVNSNAVSLSPTIILPGAATITGTSATFGSLSGLFPVSGASSALTIGNVFTNPGPSLQTGNVWFLNNSYNGNTHFCYFDNGQGYECALTNLDNPSNFANGVTGTGATALAISPLFTTPSIDNATGISLTLNSTTGDNMDLQAGTVTPYIQQLPAAGHIKTGYGSDNRYQASNNNTAFSDFLLFSDTVSWSGSATVAGAIPMQVGVANFTGIIGALSISPIHSTAPQGQYQLSVYLNEIPTLCSNVTAGVVQAQLTYTDSQGAVTKNLVSMSFTTSGSGNAQATVTFWNAASSTISVGTVYTACTTGTGTYDAHFSLLRLQ